MAEKFDDLLDNRKVRLQWENRYLAAQQELARFLEPIVKGFREAAAKLVIGRIEFDLLCAIARDQAAGAGEFGFQWIENEGGNNVVVPSKSVEKPTCRFIITLEIAHDADERVMRRQPAGLTENEVEAARVWRSITIGIERPVLSYDRLQDLHNGLAAAPWFDNDGLGVVENDCSNSVADIQRPPGRQGGHFRCRDRFHCDATSKEHAKALVNNEQCRAIPLLCVNSSMRLAHASGYLPIDTSDVVTGKVIADLLEIQSASAKPGSFPTRQKALDGLARQK